LSRKSVRKHFDYLGAMFKFGVPRGYLDRDPTAGIKPKLARRSTPARVGHSDDDLMTLFSSPNYQGHGGDAYRVAPGKEVTKDHKFWLALICVFSGARLDEPGSARLEDIEVDVATGIPFIRYAEFMRPNNGNKRSLKGVFARKVPLHQTILDAGFMGYVDELRANGEFYLFPQLNHDADDPTGSFGSWFGRHCRALNASLEGAAGTGLDDPKKDFHSFRHTFKRACRRARIGKNVYDALMGHSHGDVSDGYGVDEEGTTFDLDTLNDAMQGVSYPDFPKIS
jgi:integrase